MSIDFKLRRYWIVLILAQIVGVLGAWFFFTTGLSWNMPVSFMVAMFGADLSAMLTLPIYLKMRARSVRKKQPPLTPLV